jgi:hypothetical protein
MAGESIVTFIPTHESAPQRSAEVVEWIQSWFGKDSCLLEPMDWFN